MGYVAGLDFGTSGARITVLDATSAVALQRAIAYPDHGSDWSDRWFLALTQLLQAIPANQRQALQGIGINGTSATVLLCDAAGVPVAEPLLYNDDRGQAHRDRLRSVAPPGSPVLSATSSLVKLLWWQANLPAPDWQQARYLMHQADWLAFHLHGQPGLSDYHNALKLGYDVGILAYPDWLRTWPELGSLLPKVHPPGTVLGRVHEAIAERYQLPNTCQVVAGTTDSIAAFLASGARSPGEAVTSLGSTLVLKLLSETRVDDEQYGIYSHRLGDLWLVGGASNTGGHVLRQYFTDAELITLSEEIRPEHPSGLDYYPLSQPGERFPINDPTLPPRLTPRPAEPARFLQGLLEGMAHIESLGYQRLQALGATPLRRILTAGGGAQNSTWTAIRQRQLAVPVAIAPSTEASLGTARLVWQGLT